jgi:diphthamide synthase (EF-2-diphthine--ammonia ligase)
VDEFTGVIFGDIHLVDVRDWYETRVVAAGLEHVEPIWGEPPAALLAEFVSSGGRAVLTCVELAKLEDSWLGRVTDAQFAAEIQITGVDACGENGEYHSFAFEGPAFQRPVRWTAGERRQEAGFAQLDLTGGIRGSAPLGPGARRAH